MTERVCKKCGDKKPIEEFRERIYDGKYKCRIHVCRKCEVEYNINWYSKRKHDPVFKRKNADRVKKDREQHLEKYTERAKKKRATPEYKEYCKQYLAANKEKITQQSRIRNRKYLRRKYPERVKYILEKIKERNNKPYEFSI